MKDDLLDRVILLELQPIAADCRRERGEFWASFDAELPGIFGGLCDVLSRALRELPNASTEDLPRMSEFAVWNRAVDLATGFQFGNFDDAYEENRLQKMNGT